MQQLESVSAPADTLPSRLQYGLSTGFLRLNSGIMGGGASTSSGKYVGQKLRGSIRHGRGSCALADGSYYEGDW